MRGGRFTARAPAFKRTRLGLPFGACLKAGALFSALCGGLLAQDALSIVWKESLVFDPDTGTGGPLPVSTMNFAVHKGRLFAGMAADFEQRGYSAHSASVYLKSSATSKWTLHASFGPGTERGRNDALGAVEPRLRRKTNSRGTIERLLAGVVKMRQATQAITSSGLV